MTNVKLDDGLIRGDSVCAVLNSAMDAGGGLLRLTPTWVPRSFLHPGRRIKLHPGDYYRCGADHGGIDERWFGSTTDAANDGRVWHEGKPESYYFPPQLNNVDNNFAYTFTGLEPGTQPEDVRCCSGNWNEGDNGILDLQTPAMIRFGKNTSDEVFISHVAATGGVEIENLGTEPLVGLRYFGPNTHNDLPRAGSSLGNC